VGVPHGAGLTAEANEPAWQTDARYAAQYPSAATRPDFSNPVALFNNIFWNNDAYTLTQFGPGATLVDNGFIDFEIHGTGNAADTFTPRYSDLTNGSILGAGGLQPLPGAQGNTIGVDPGFVAPFILELTVAGSRLDPQAAAVTITGADPPVGLTGDYHIALPAGLIARLIAAAGSPVVDRGVRCSNTPFPPPGPPAAPNAPCAGGGIQAPTLTPTLANPAGGDFDREYRPQAITVRVRTPWDVGADESVGLNLPLP
jgi:hypothetical protein